MSQDAQPIKRRSPVLLMAGLLSLFASPYSLNGSTGSNGGGTKKKATKGGTKGAFGNCRNTPSAR